MKFKVALLIFTCLTSSYGANQANDSKSVHSFQESFGQEIINATEEKSSTQESIMELKEEHNLFNAVGERIVVNVRAVVTKE